MSNALRGTTGRWPATSKDPRRLERIVVARRSIILHLVSVVIASSAAFPERAMTQSIPPAGGAVLTSGTLSFTGRATVGDFVGSTTAVSGAVVGDIPAVRGWVEAPVATLATQNDRRDRDLRSSMEVDRYPTMRFELSGATLVSSTTGTSRADSVVLHGTLAIHGVSRAVDLHATLSRIGDTLLLQAAFPLDLADYRIGGLTKLFGLLRMQPRIEVRVHLQFVTSRSLAVDRPT